MADPANCPCLRCTLARTFNAWMDAQPDSTVDQEEVTKALVSFLGQALNTMPIYEKLHPMRIEVIARKAEAGEESEERKLN